MKGLTLLLYLNSVYSAIEYTNRALGCSLCYRQNIDKPQLSSVSGTIFWGAVH